MLHFALPLVFAAASCVGVSDGLLDKGYRETYDLQFAAAHRDFAQFEKEHPANPLGPAGDAAAYLFTEFDRLKILRANFLAKNKSMFQGKKVTPDPANAKGFNTDLERSKKLSEAALAKSPNDPAARLATVFRFALEADYDALIAKKYGRALAEIKAASRNAHVLLAKHPDCYDAKLAIGFENYVLSFKRAPVRWFLSLTGAESNRKKGLKDMRVVGEKGHYMKPYANVLLTIAALRSGHKKEAKKLLTQLVGKFPDNDLFQSELKKLS